MRWSYTKRPGADVGDLEDNYALLITGRVYSLKTTFGQNAADVGCELVYALPRLLVIHPSSHSGRLLHIASILGHQRHGELRRDFPG